jgi:hypothetical protein
MRSTLLSTLVLVLATTALAQAAPTTMPAKPASQAVAPHPKFNHCCREKVWDARGNEIGDLVGYDERFASQTVTGYVAYHLKGGDAVVLQVAPLLLNGLQSTGGSSALFTTPDCSGNTMFSVISWPPLAKRYATVLLAGSSSYLLMQATSAWLFVTDPLPPRVVPGAGTVFHSQWGESGACVPYPAPGYVMNYQPGGFWMHRVEDLYAKFTRPFYVDY